MKGEYIVFDIEKAWRLFFEGKITEARLLAEKEFDLDNCNNFSLMNLMGYYLLDAKEYDRALKVFEKYIDLSQRENDRGNEHIGLHQLAMVYKELEKYQVALDLIEKEKTLILEYFSNNLLKQAVNSYEQGYLRYKLGYFDRSLIYMKTSLEQSLQTDDSIAQACANRGLGEIYHALKKLELAKMHFEEAIKLFRQAGDSLGAIEVENMMYNIE